MREIYFENFTRVSIDRVMCNIWSISISNFILVCKSGFVKEIFILIGETMTTIKS